MTGEEDNAVADAVDAVALDDTITAEEIETLRDDGILCVGSKYHIMTPTGYYDTLGVSLVNLPARIRELKMACLMPIYETNAKGEVRDVPERTLVKRYGVQIDEIEGVTGTAVGPYGVRGAWWTLRDDGKRIMHMPLYGLRTDLEAQYNPDVAEWLRRLVGPARVGKLCEWIGHALSVGEPICALSLAGASGAGKKMFVLGLAECLTTRAYADGAELLAPFQYGLAKSPFLVVNEGLVSDTRHGSAAADAFRRLVAGDNITINRKFEAPITITAPVRVVFTTNNTDTVKLLAGHKDLSPEDRDALAQRLLHFDVLQDAADWLRSNGGLQFTGAPGTRWVRADNGKDGSDHVIAKHFMWLRSRRTQTSGKRLLVEGDAQSVLTFEMQTQSGSAPVVVEALVGMMNSKRPMEGFVTETAPDGSPVISALPTEVLKYLRANNPSASSRLSAKQVGSVFRGLMKARAALPRVHPLRPSVGNQRWYSLDPVVLLAAARNDGWACPSLEAMVEGAAPKAPVPTVQAAPAPLRSRLKARA